MEQIIIDLLNKGVPMEIEFVKTAQEGEYTGSLTIHFNKVIPDQDPDDNDKPQVFTARYINGKLDFSIGDDQKVFFTGSLDAKGNLVGTFNVPHQGIEFLSGKWVVSKQP